MATVQFVTISDREYGRCIYQDGTRHYAVLTERRNQYGLRIQRTLNTPAIIAKIEAAIAEQEAAGDCEVRKTFYANPGWQRQLIATAHREAMELDAAFEARKPDLAQRALCFRLRYTAEGQARHIREAHAEALQMDAAMDGKAMTYDGVEVVEIDRTEKDVQLKVITKAPWDFSPEVGSTFWVPKDDKFIQQGASK